MIQKNGFGEMKTLRRSPRMTSGVAMLNAHASSSMATVMAIPATTPAKKPVAIALDLLIENKSYKATTRSELKCVAPEHSLSAHAHGGFTNPPPKRETTYDKTAGQNVCSANRAGGLCS